MTKIARCRRPARPAPSASIAQLRTRLADAEETLRAIHAGEVDAVVVAGKTGTRVFTLEGADHAYRVLIESMSEGALTLTADGTVLYANRCFAGMVKCSSEQVTGSSFARFVSTADLAALRPLFTRAKKSGSKLQLLLSADDGSRVPVQISVQSLAGHGSGSKTVSMVVTDMTGVRHNEDMLRALSRRLVQAQEAERGRVALELHDHITQLLCAILYRTQALANKLSAHDGPLKEDATRLREMIGTTAEEVERISRHLRPGVLDQLGLSAVLRAAASDFAKRTKLPLKVSVPNLAVRLPADIELTLYRILQEALRNVEQHARARHVTVSLTRRRSVVRLAIRDDGIGFDPSQLPVRGRRKAGLGLLSMRERASYVDGIVEVRSTRRTGTQIEARIPLPPRPAPADRADPTAATPAAQPAAR